MRLSIIFLIILYLAFFAGCRKESNLPGVYTSDITGITLTTAISGGYVISDGGDSVITRGVCWSTEKNPTTDHFKTTNGSDTGLFVSSLTGLINGTVYYVRAYAVNQNGTGYGDVKSFKCGTVKDIHGNIYSTVPIGNQIWMTENLRVLKYRDGTDIPIVPDNSWKTLTTGAVCFFDNDLSYRYIYGGLYNFYAVTNTRKICPVGWHIPTSAEWDTLITFLGGRLAAGGPMKETGFKHWGAPNTGATNSTGFTALPAGIRSDFYGLMGETGMWWSSSQSLSLTGNGMGVQITNSASDCTLLSFPKTYGVSVRCIKDQISY